MWLLNNGRNLTWNAPPSPLHLNVANAGGFQERQMCSDPPVNIELGGMGAARPINPQDIPG